MNHLASVETNTFDPDGLFADGGNIRDEKVTIPDGTAALVRGTVMGKIAVGAATSAAKSGGNTGNGTLTMDVTTPVKNGAKTGIYTTRCIEAASNNGTFIVRDPDGFQIGTIVMSGGAGTFDDDIKFALADGGTDFAVGDGFDITVAAGSGKFIKSVAAATDGSQTPYGILAHDTDAASGADIEALIYTGGSFNSDNLTLGAGHTAASIKEGLRDKGIYITA